MKRVVTRFRLLGGLLGLLSLPLVGCGQQSKATQTNPGAPAAVAKGAPAVPVHEGQPVSFWIEQLKSQDAESRRRAAGAFVAMGEPSYPALAQFLNTPYKPDDRRNVALDRAEASFAESGPPAVPALLAAVRLEASGDLRHNGGIAALTRMGAAAAPALAKALRDPDKEVRASSVLALRFVSLSGQLTPTLTSALITVLRSDPVPEVRAEAAMTLSASQPPSKEARSALVEALKDQNDMVRLQAASGLSSAGVLSGQRVQEAAAGLPVLIQALKGHDAGARFQAAMALQQLGPTARSAIPELAAVLKDSETGQWAAEALGAIGGEAIAVLEKAANGSNRAARNNAAQVLGRLGLQGKTSASALLADLRKPDPQVRMAAASSIQSTAPDDPRVIPALIAGLKDKDKYVRERMAYALTSYGPKAKAAVPALMRLLSGDPMQSAAAIAALGAIGPAAKPAIPALRAAMAKERFNRAGEALAKMGPAGLAALTAAMKDRNKDVRSQAMDGLYSLGADARPALPSLIAALDDAEPTVCNFAAQTLGAIGPAAKPAVPKLVAKLKDKDTNARAWAAHALGQIGQGATPAIPALTAAAADANEGVSWEAAQALVLLGAEEKAVPALVQVAKNKRGVMRANALALLRRTGTAAHAAAGPLAEIVSDTSETPFVRLASAAALTSVDPSSTAGISFLRESLRHSNGQVRLAAAAGMSELHVGGAEIPAALRPLLQSEDKQIGVTAARLLVAANPKDQTAIGHLSSALNQDDRMVSFAAAKALADLGMSSPRSIGILTECLRNRDLGWGIQRESALALGSIGAPARGALSALEKLLAGSPEPPLRQAVAVAVRQLRGERSVSSGEVDSTPTLFDQLVEAGGMSGRMGIG